MSNETILVFLVLWILISSVAGVEGSLAFVIFGSLLFLSGCGSDTYEYNPSDDLEALSLEKLAPDSFEAPGFLLESLHTICTESKISEASQVYETCLSIYSSGTPFDAETRCASNYEQNISKIENNWALVYYQSKSFLKTCLIDVAFLSDSKEIEDFKQSCYADFERVFLLRASSCQSVYLKQF